MCILRFSFGPISPGGGQVGPNCWREFWFSEMQAVLPRFQQFKLLGELKKKNRLRLWSFPWFDVGFTWWQMMHHCAWCFYPAGIWLLPGLPMKNEICQEDARVVIPQLFLFTEYIECTSMSCALWKVEIWKLSAIMSATSPASTSSTMLDSSMVTMSNCGES